MDPVGSVSAGHATAIRSARAFVCKAAIQMLNLARNLGRIGIGASLVQIGGGKHCRKWRTRKDSNLRPLPSEGSALSS